MRLIISVPCRRLVVCQDFTVCTSGGSTLEQGVQLHPQFLALHPQFGMQQKSTRKPCYRKENRTMRPVYGCPEKFRESLATPTATFPEIVNGLQLSQHQSHLGYHTLKFKGSQLWNRLPHDLMEITSPASFRKLLKHYLMYNPM